jgi:glycosyltransferase involved in cell wall biosynthesis
VICTYAADEPIDQILDATRLIGMQVEFRFTGRSEKLPAEVRNDLPPNVVLTGFLSEENYLKELADCHVVLDLTTMPHCLVCGSYEALATGRPMILTKSAACERLFKDVSAFTDNSADSIANAIRDLLANYERFRESIGPAQVRFERDWAQSLVSLTKVMEG